MLQKRPELEPAPIQLTSPTDQKQRQRMLLAIALLLVALSVVLLKDWHFWFEGKEDTTEEEMVDASSSAASPARRVPLSAPSTAKVKRGVPKDPTEQVSEPPAVVATNRTPLPPLQVEVIAGDNRQIAQPRNNSVKVEMGSLLADEKMPNSLSAANETSGTMNAAERVHMSAVTARAVDRPVNPSYPLLARQMKVQGAVELQALIGTDGTIQDLRVLRGPAILASAAREAVRQWRFKPYLVNGQSVETEAKITVNFTISTF